MARPSQRGQVLIEAILLFLFLTTFFSLVLHQSEQAKPRIEKFYFSRTKGKK